METIPDELVLLCFSGVHTTRAPNSRIRHILRSARPPGGRLQCIRSFVLPQSVNKHIFHFAVPTHPVWFFSSDHVVDSALCRETFDNWLNLVDRSVAIHVPPAQFDIVRSASEDCVQLLPRGRVWLNGCVKIGGGECIVLHIDMATQLVKRAELCICCDQSCGYKSTLHVEVQPLLFGSVEQARLWGVIV